MPVQKITIEEFLKLAWQYPVLDVRSPGEYTHAQIPGAHNLPLFTDEERKNVGTTYKQQSREKAIKIGLDYFGPKMKTMVEEAESLVRNTEPGKEKKQPFNSEPRTPNSVIVHCWRGGMRSAAVAWLLDLYGFKVYTLAGGYKAYRKWVREQFKIPHQLTIVGGYTGSGKTLALHKIKEAGVSVVDLEALANHKGSAFGAVGKQPTQEMFENLLARELNKLSESKVPSMGGDLGEAAFIEDESQRIGNLQIPIPFWNNMRKSTILYLDIPFEKRLDYITEEYSKTEKEKLVNSIIRIQKRLGGLDTKTAINHLLEDDYKESFRILLRYYDKWYEKALHNRENLSLLLNKIPCGSVDTTVNVQKILSCKKTGLTV